MKKAGPLTRVREREKERQEERRGREGRAKEICEKWCDLIVCFLDFQVPSTDFRQLKFHLFAVVVVVVFDNIVTRILRY